MIETIDLLAIPLIALTLLVSLGMHIWTRRLRYHVKASNLEGATCQDFRSTEEALVYMSILKQRCYTLITLTRRKGPEVKLVLELEDRGLPGFPNYRLTTYSEGVVDSQLDTDFARALLLQQTPR